MKTAAEFIIAAPALHVALVLSSGSSSNTMNVPIICTLTGPELAERKRTVVDAVLNTHVRTYRLANGYAYEFPAAREVLEKLKTLVALERQCCQFLAFSIIEIPKKIRLEVTGSPEALAVIEDLFRGADKE